MEADITSQAVGLASNTDFSLWSLFLRADFIVKSVILMLIGCSIYSWAVIIEKFRLFKKINLESEEFEEKFWKSKSAETFYNTLPSNIADPMAYLFKESMQVFIFGIIPLIIISSLIILFACSTVISDINFLFLS